MQAVVVDVDDLILLENEKRGLCLPMSYLQSLALPRKTTGLPDMRIQIRVMMRWLSNYVASTSENECVLSEAGQHVVLSWDDALIENIVVIDGRIPPE